MRKKGGNKLKETDLFKPVKELLVASDMEVYTEVPCGLGRADVVGIKDNLVTVVELKTSLNLQLIQQAYDRLGYAHYVYIAVPYFKNRIPRIVRSLCRRDGIGVIEIYDNYANVFIHGKILRNSYVDWAKNLNDGYKCENNISAGVNRGFYSPYQDMVQSVKKYIKRNHPNPVSITDILEYVDIVSKHYVQPKTSLYLALKEYEKDWCELIKIDDKTYFKMRSIEND